MKTLTLILALVAGCLSASAQTIPTNSFYLGSVPHKTNAPIVFELRLVRYPGEFPRIQLLGYDIVAFGRPFTIALSGSVTNKPNGLIHARFPFGGHYRGRFDAERNLVIGRLYSFPRDRQHPISRRRFEVSYYAPIFTGGGHFPGPE